MYIWPVVFVSNRVTPLELPKTALLRLPFITIIGSDLSLIASTMKKRVIITGIGFGRLVMVIQETRVRMNLISPAGDLTKTNTLLQLILSEAFMGLTLPSVHRKLQIHNPPYINTAMGKCLSLKHADATLIQNLA